MKEKKRKESVFAEKKLFTGKMNLELTNSINIMQPFTAVHSLITLCAS